MELESQFNQSHKTEKFLTRKTHSSVDLTWEAALNLKFLGLETTTNKMSAKHLLIHTRTKMVRLSTPSNHQLPNINNSKNLISTTNGNSNNNNSSLNRLKIKAQMASIQTILQSRKPTQIFHITNGRSSSCRPPSNNNATTRIQACMTPNLEGNNNNSRIINLNNNNSNILHQRKLLKIRLFLIYRPL